MDDLYNKSNMKIIREEIEEGRYKSMDIENVDLYRCICCQTNINGVASAVAHAKGKKHLNKANKQPTSASNVNSIISQISNLSTSENKFTPYSSSGSSSGSREESLERRAVSLSPVNSMNRQFSIEDSIKRNILKPEGNGYICLYCSNLVLTSDVVANQHIAGSKHHKKLSSRPSDPDSFETSFERVFASSPNQKISVSHLSPLNDKKKALDDNLFFCSDCNVTLNSESQYTAHNRGKSHSKKVASRPLSEQSNGLTAKEPGPERTIDPVSGTDFSSEIIIIHAFETLKDLRIFSNISL